MRQLILAALAGAAIPFGSLAGQKRSAPDALSGLDAQVEKMLADWKVPGLALAVVRGDSVVARGFGVRDAGKPDRVGPDTRFSIGSCSKAFTAAAIADQVSAGKLRYEDRVIDWLPWFRTPDPWITREIRVRDLLAHRSGYDLFVENRLWPFVGNARDLVVKTTLEDATSGFRERYRYSNSMFSAAGLVVEAVAGARYEQVVTSRIFQPLGMTRTITSAREQLAGSDFAIGHTTRGDAIVPETRDFQADSTLVATGGVISTAADMGKWIRFQLGSGRIGPTRLVDSAVFAEQHIGHTPARGGPVEAAYWFAHVNAADLETRHWAYGLGWFITDYRGRSLVWHGGTYNGYRCAVAFLPDERVGVYVGVNRMTLLAPAMMFTMLDRLTGQTGRDWNAIFLREAGLQADDARRAAAARPARATGTSPSSPPASHAGRYRHPAIGELAIDASDGGLVATIGRQRGTLEHWERDTWRIVWDGLAPTLATFTTEPGGRMTAVTIEGLGTFRRAAP